MSGSWRRWLLPLVALVVLLAGCGSAPRPTGAAARDRLPDTTLSPLREGEPLAVRKLRGPAVVNLWASWCTPCRKELPHYQQFSRKYAGKVDVIGVDYQETRPDAARQLARETGVTYPLYSDPDGKFRAIGLPKLILVDGRGRVAHQEYVEIKSLTQLETLVQRHLEVR